MKRDSEANLNPSAARAHFHYNKDKHQKKLLERVAFLYAYNPYYGLE